MDGPGGLPLRDRAAGILRTVLLRRPLLGSVALAALALGVMWCGNRLALRAFPGSPLFGTLERIPILLFVLLLLVLGRWWRGAGFRRPRLRDLRHGWPAAALVLYLLPLAAWRGSHPWLPLALEQATTAFWEESLFRGIILLLLARRSDRLALFGSATLFVLIHAFNIATAGGFDHAIWNTVWPFGLGLIFAALRLRTGSIWPCIGAHFLLNLVDDLSPEPLSWSGQGLLGVPVELLLFLVLFVSCGLHTLPRLRPVTRLATTAAAAGIWGLCAVGILVFDGPRPGWEGPGLDATVSVRSAEEGGAWRYSYKLRFRTSQAEIVSFGLSLEGDPAVDELQAVAGDETWEGALDGQELVWRGGIAPETVYGFRCRRPPNGEALFRVVYVDRYGWLREWADTLDGPGD